MALLLLLAEMLPLLASMPSLEHTGASTELISYLLDRRLKVRQQTGCEAPMHCLKSSIPQQQHTKCLWSMGDCQDALDSLHSCCLLTIQPQVLSTLRRLCTSI